jgi:hypothetical protein
MHTEWNRTVRSHCGSFIFRRILTALAFSHGLLSCKSSVSGAGNPDAAAKIRASLSLKIKYARKPVPIACIALASKNLRNVFIVAWLTDTRNPELALFFVRMAGIRFRTCHCVELDIASRGFIREASALAKADG